MSAIASAASPLLPVRFDEVRAHAEPGMAEVDRLIRRRLGSDVMLVNQVAEHIVSGGGKRLRPMLVLLAAEAAGYRGTQHFQAAANAPCGGAQGLWWHIRYAWPGDRALHRAVVRL